MSFATSQLTYSEVYEGRNWIEELFELNQTLRLKTGFTRVVDGNLPRQVG